MKAKLLALTGIASAFLWVSAASAATVTIGAAPGAGPLRLLLRWRRRQPEPHRSRASRVPQRFGAYLTRTKSLLPAGL